MCDFYINHIHFQIGDGRGEFSTLITKEAYNEYAIAKYGKVPTNETEKCMVKSEMCLKTVWRATHNNWRKMHKLPMLKRRTRK